MSYESVLKSSLLIRNGKAGKGQASNLSEEIHLETDISTESFEYFLSAFEYASERERRLLLESYSHLFVLGGDGSTLSLLRLLLQQQLNQDITVTALGMGGENVVAKEQGTYKHPLQAVKAVLQGKYQKELVVPLSVNVAENQETEPFLWSVHMGFSAAVLSELETMRSLGMGNFRRRYQAVLQTLVRQRQLDPTYVSLDGESPKTVVDMGVLSSAFPYWTSKFRLPTTSNSPAILHTVQGYEELQKQPSIFSARLLLEVISLKMGVPIPYRLLQHQPLDPGFSVEVFSASQQTAVDSELIDSSKNTVSDTGAFPGNGQVFLARL